MNERKSEILVGVFALIGTTVLMVTVVMFANITDMFKDTYDVLVYFDNARGVRPGIAVTISGVPVGWVQQVSLAERGGEMKVELRLRIHSDVPVRRDAEVAIKTEGLIANPVIDIRQAPVDPLRAVAADTLPRTGEPARIDGIPTPNIEEVFERIIAFADDMQSFMADADVRGSLRNAIGQLETFTGRLVEASDGTAPADIRTAVENLRKFTDSANLLMSDARVFTGMMHRMTEKNQESLHRLVASMVDNSERIDGALASLDEIMRQVAGGQGTVGRLLKDNEAYAEVLQVMTEAKKSLEEIRATIKHIRETARFSIF